MAGSDQMYLPRVASLQRRVARGFTLIELMVGVAMISLILYFMVPSMGVWMQSSQIRTATESIYSGLQLARTEAVRRNTAVELVFTSVAGGGNETDWAVRCVVPSATCPGAGQAETSIQSREGRSGSPNATMAVNPAMASVAYTGTGRLTPVPAGNILINVGHRTANSCITDGGEYRCLRIVISSGGQVRMCDPALAAPNPRAC